jgi:hypothetical protein
VVGGGGVGRNRILLRLSWFPVATMISFSSNSTDNLLNSFPMFGHPGISALEYAGQVENRRALSTEVSLKRKSTNSTQHDSATAEADREGEELDPPVHYLDEFGNQQRRRGTFINHTPRHFEMRTSKSVDVYQPSRAGSENYSRPLSRQSSSSPALPSQSGHSPSTSSGTFGKRSALSHDHVAELDATEISSPSSPKVNRPSTRSHRRSLSAPPSKILTYQSAASTLIGQFSRDPSLRSTSLSDHQPLETKRQRRQTPFKLSTSKQRITPRHSPLEPWVAEHRRKEIVEKIGDVPVDMDREVSAEIGTFGVIQRYFDSQGGGPVSSVRIAAESPAPTVPVPPLPVSPEISLRKRFMEASAIYPIDELELPADPPPVPNRSPKRLTSPGFPITTKSTVVRDSDFIVAAEGEYSPYDEDSDALHIPKKRTQERPDVGQAAWVGSPNVGKLAPPILGHDALTASSDLALNELSYYLKHTGPPPKPQLMTPQEKKKGMKLFKAKQRKTLAARVGSVEGSPQRARSRPAVPSCAREMTTSGGARHLKIIIPTDTVSGTQAVALPMSKARERRSRHISITFTEEMLNPLASPEVERMISTFDIPERSFSAPIPTSPRSPKRSPRTPKFERVDDHPLAEEEERKRASCNEQLCATCAEEARMNREELNCASGEEEARSSCDKQTLASSDSQPRASCDEQTLASRNEQTRARKLRDLQRIKRKPVPDRTPSEQHQDATTGGALLTPAHTPEPVVRAGSEDEESPAIKMDRLQNHVVSLQRQNMQLAEALAKIVGLDLEDGDVKSDEVLKAFREFGKSRVVRVA